MNKYIVIGPDPRKDRDLVLWIDADTPQAAMEKATRWGASFAPNALINVIPYTQCFNFTPTTTYSLFGESK